MVCDVSSDVCLPEIEQTDKRIYRTNGTAWIAVSMSAGPCSLTRDVLRLQCGRTSITREIIQQIKPV